MNKPENKIELNKEEALLKIKAIKDSNGRCLFSNQSDRLSTKLSSIDWSLQKRFQLQLYIIPIVP